MKSAIAKQRDILDRRRLTAALDALAATRAHLDRDRAPVVDVLREALKNGAAEIYRRFEAANDGDKTVREQCFLIDQLLRVLYDFVTTRLFPLANPTAGEHMAVVAVGG